MTPLQKSLPHLSAEIQAIESQEFPDFLHSKSYLDCTTPIDEYEIAELIAHVKTNPAGYHKAVATPERMKAILNMVEQSVTIERSTRKIICKELRASLGIAEEPA